MNRLIKTVLVAFTLLSAITQAETLQVIVHKSVAVDSLKRQEIRSLFLGKAVRLPDGIELIPIDIAESNDLYETFCRKVIGKSPAQVSSHWSRQIFNGKGTPPKQLASVSAIVEQVSKTPTAIAYITGPITSSDVKVVYSIDF
jgi:ABC-type phosphate transport system substrate-binding protein